MDFASFYTRNAASFLDARQLRTGDLDALARKQYEDASCVLLTSSAVHGIANAASDIDLIAIRRADGIETAMATQLHCGDAHLEVLAFTEAQLKQAESAARAMAAMPVRDRLAACRRWDKETTIPRKYLERICTGVDMQGGVPFLALQEAVARVWATVSCDQARQCAMFCALACRSGERRAAAGYAGNALLFAMNALLSSLGWPLINKKWTLKRWSVAPTLFPSSPLLAEFGARSSRAWQAVAERWGSPLHDHDALELAALVESLCAVLLDGAPPQDVPVAGSAPLLPGACMVSDSVRQRVALLGDAPADALADATPSSLFRLAPGDAAYWLGAARSRVANFSLA
jgi:hypothetical protein